MLSVNKINCPKSVKQASIKYLEWSTLQLMPTTSQYQFQLIQFFTELIVGRILNGHAFITNFLWHKSNQQFIGLIQMSLHKYTTWNLWTFYFLPILTLHIPQSTRHGHHTVLHDRMVLSFTNTPHNAPVGASFGDLLRNLSVLYRERLKCPMTLAIMCTENRKSSRYQFCRHQWRQSWYHASELKSYKSPSATFLLCPSSFCK